MRVLVIDDTPANRRRLEVIGGHLGECCAVDTGTAAVDLFRESGKAGTPFGLVFLDINVTSTSGTQTLRLLRKTETEQNVAKSHRAKIIVFTSDAEQQTVLSYIRAGCDGFVVRPFTLEAVAQKVVELCGPAEPDSEEEAEADPKTAKAQRLVQGVIARFESGACDLPTLPSVVHEIRSVMDSPSSTVKTMAAVIEKDPVLSVKVIAVSNSPLYRGRERISSLKNAIPRLGFKGIQSIVNAVANSTMYQTQNAEAQKKMGRLWVHSLAVAYGAREIGAQVRFSDVERLFLMGLVHDIGKVVLSNEMSKVDAIAEEVGNLRITRVIDELHTSFGGTLLQAWGFGQDFADIAEEHETTDFTTSASKPLIIVSVANTLAREMGYSLSRAQNLEMHTLSGARILKLSAEHFTTLRGQLELTVKKACIAFKL